MADGVVSAAKLPPRIGRHTVLGYLADGGMSEIFLGKEPDGRPVVIKRILPHLARQQNFVSMFIDEARIGSQIKHPNVVDIYELGQVGTDLFMVMEYLAGESVSGLLRRMELRQERLPIALAAFVIAEAAAGLSAAHDLRDHQGKPLGIVHRDISPSNLFLTYGGEVKVLDFGIATAADRISRTATGHVKGKFSYMSPEQCLGMSLEARSDIWSLGVVLYELSTQRRLFKRPNELLVLKAVTQDPIPRPRKELPQYPQFMEQIVMRALSREPARRPTALELHEELTDAMHKLGFTGDPRQELAHVMADVFPERMEEKRALLRDMRMGTERFEQLPAAEVDQQVELAQMAEQSLTQAPPNKQRRSSIVVIVAMVLVLAIGIGTWVFTHRDQTRHIAAPDPEPVVTMPVTPPAPVEPPVTPAQVVGLPRAPDTTKPDTDIHIVIDSAPAGAAVKVDGKRVGNTPTKYVLPPTGKTIDLTITKPGFVEIHQKLKIENDQRLLIPLVEKAKPAGKKKKDPKDPFQRFD